MCLPNSIYNLKEYVQPNTRLLLVETMSNPLLQVLDIRRLALETKQAGDKAGGR